MKVQAGGADDLARLAKRARLVGADKAVMREAQKTFREITKPVIKEGRKGVKASARRTLPKSGGLNRYVARSSIRLLVRPGARALTVSIRASKRKQGGKVDLRAINRGRVRHPVFGNRGRWRTQQVPPRFWSDPIDNIADRAKSEMREAMRRIAETLED